MLYLSPVFCRQLPHEPLHHTLAVHLLELGGGITERLWAARPILVKVHQLIGKLAGQLHQVVHSNEVQKLE